MAVISKGIELRYKLQDTTDIVALTNLQEIPELGGEVEAIEITTLSDAAHMYTDGLINYGDSLAFKFLYEGGQYEELVGLGGNEVDWTIALPDGVECDFKGKCSVKLDGVGVGAVMTYTLNIKPTSEMNWSF